MTRFDIITFFIKHSPKCKISLLVIYVDDIIVVGDSEHDKQILKEKIVAQCKMNDLGNLKYFLGIKVGYSK